jgi:uncharacterized membrane protein YjgN (DUF898 family)
MTVSNPAISTTDDARPSQDLAFDFTGNGWEYFKIWIVNILLTILTLGIYSAWAKVRTEQYFYGNTLLDGASFRYTAKPMTILKGRLIAVATFVVFSLAQEFMPPLALIMIAAFLIALPAIIVRAMAFKLGNSVHRNVAFGFRRSYKQAYAVFLGPTLALVVLVAVFGFGVQAMGGGENGSAAVGIGIAMLAYLLGIPFFNYLASSFYVNNSRYGDSDFAYAGGAGGFYKLYGMTLLIALLAMVAIGLAVGAVAGESLAMLNQVRAAGGEVDGGQAIMLLMSQGALLLVLVPAYTLIFAYFQAKRFNLIYGNSVLADNYGFRAALRTGGLAWLYLSNMLLIVITLGLAIPWAKVRTARYHLDNLAFVAADDLNRFAAAQQERVSALGDEFGEVFDLEVGI